MQRKQTKTSSSRFLWMLLIIPAAMLVIFASRLISGGKTETGVGCWQLPCSYSDGIRAFGKNVLYYDGASIHCMSDTGTVRWSYPIGTNAGYDCNETTMVAWTGSTIAIVDQSGNSSYNDNLGEEVQFARVGEQYVAAVLGDTTSPRLVVKDLTGAHMDEEADAFDRKIILDVGFYGSHGQYMWTLSLDVFGTAANTVFNTFEVGKMNTGEVNLGDAVNYEVLYESGKLRVISTRKMMSFSLNGTQDNTADVLVYGWHFLHSEIQDKGNALMLFAPTSQTESLYDIRELRLVNGAGDKRYSLPDSCVGALMYRKTIYAFSGSTLYRAGMNDNRFATFELPMNEKATRVLDILTSGKAIVACGDKVYTVSLPVISAVQRAASAN